MGGPGPEAGSGSEPAQEFAPVVLLDSDDGAPVSPQRGEHVPIAEMSAGDLLPPPAPLADRPQLEGGQQMHGRPVGREEGDNRVFVPQWDVREGDRSFQPPSVARRLIQGSMLPADNVLVSDLMDTYKGENEFVDYCYGRMREVFASSLFLYSRWLRCLKFNYADAMFFVFSTGNRFYGRDAQVL